MQFTRYTSKSKSANYLKILLKVSLLVMIIFGVVTILNKIDFPSPNKKIEKTIPNENLKIVK
tara:strand:- start:14 stop:199 length:186 start_codon:yes stop_codon:yes gene_type:complete